MPEEEVDGRQIAANILKHFQPKARQTILAKMAAKSPEITREVTHLIDTTSRNMTTESTSVLNSEELEHNLQKLSDEEIAIALHGEPNQIQEHIFQHITPRRQQAILHLINDMPLDSLQAKTKIATKLALHNKGKIVAVG
jgi:flagellar motor switch protein FliG